MLILAFEANSALSRENETKIVKITHSKVGTYNLQSFIFQAVNVKAQDFLMYILT